MKAEERHRVLEELAWHCDHPARMAVHLTDEEATDIHRRGFVTKELWKSLEARAALAEGEADV